MFQYHLPFIQRTYAGAVIEQRAQDGFINATAMCKVAAKEWGHYAANKQTTAFMDALAAKLGIPSLALTEVRRGGNAPGTWVHPKVALHLAQWLSPEFAVQVTDWVYDWMSGAAAGPGPATAKRVTYVFAQRYHLNSDRVDQGYFSIIGELYIRLYAKLEHAGYVLPDRGAGGKELRPDVSVGKTFPIWLQASHPEHAERWKTYRHIFQDGKEVDARQYENSVLPAFIEFVETDWIPNRAAEYLRTRDPDALQFLPKLLPAPKPANLQFPKKGAA